jgi:hypothetical protein
MGDARSHPPPRSQTDVAALGRKLFAIFPCRVFEFALERSVRQFIDVQYRAQCGRVKFNAMGGHGPSPVANNGA